MAKLGEKQAMFVKEYLIDINATQAAIRAGYSRKTAKEQAARLLSHVNVQAAIQKKMTQRGKRTEVTADRVILELARIAFGDLRGVAEWGDKGLTLKNSANLSDDDAAAISEVAETTTKDGGTLRVKRHDKVKALELLARHLGLLDPKDKASDSIGAGVITALKDIFNAD